MNYTYLYELSSTVPDTIEYGAVVLWDATQIIIQWILQAFVFVCVILVRSESPEASIRGIILLGTLAYYIIEYLRGCSVWGWRHVRRVLRYENANDEINRYNEELNNDYIETLDQRRNWEYRELTLPTHFTAEHFGLLQDARRELDCPICCQKMDVESFRILRVCCHICCLECIRQLKRLKCPHCKTNL